MRAMPRALCRPQLLVTGAPAGPESRHPPDSASTRGIARMARSYGSGSVRQHHGNRYLPARRQGRAGRHAASRQLRICTSSM